MLFYKIGCRDGYVVRSGCVFYLRLERYGWRSGYYFHNRFVNVIALVQ